ncbi:MAG: hypothetical protein AB7F31_01835 [Parachlamydiales bacterium]
MNFLLLTGLTDAPLQDLGGLTPLQKAHTPNLDRLAQEGGCLLFEPPKWGGIETTLLAMLGVEEGLDEPSAAALEAAALGIELRGDETLYCARLVSAGGGAIVEVGDELVSDTEGALLCEALSAEFAAEGLQFVSIQGPRCLMISRTPFGPLPGPGPSPFEVVGERWKALLPKGMRATLGKLLDRVGESLAEHEVNQLRSDLEEVPINALWVSEGGGVPRWMGTYRGPVGVEIWCVSSLVQGIAVSLGLPCRQLGHGLRMDREIEGLVRKLEVRPLDIRLIELPHLWESTYKGDLLEKIKRIEYLDRHLIGPLTEMGELAVLPLRHTDIRIGQVMRGPIPMVTTLPGDPLPSFDEATFSQLTLTPLNRALLLPAAR